MISRFEEHCEHMHDADIEQYRSRCEDFDQYEDHLLDIANGNNYEGEYKLNYDSYCVVASQFDSCDFYGIAVEVSSVTTYSNQGEIVYLDDDLPF